VNTDTGVAALNTMGLRNVLPSSVSVSAGSAVVNSNGTVTFTNAANINLAGIFTSEYQFYKLIIHTDGTTAPDALLAWFTNAGTSITSAWYGASFFFNYVGGTGNAYARNNGNGGVIGQYSTLNTIHTIETAFVPGNTDRLYIYQSYNMGNGENVIGGYNTNGDADGFRISPATAGRFISGTIQVYGYND
jgi:hypothetical protein